MRFPIPFIKLTGTGNDFILIDNRDGQVAGPEMQRLVVRACRRRQSVGADGLILIQDDPELDFAWRFFNSDGSEAEMCGNGARCAARFAFENGIAGKDMTFRTVAGAIHATVEGESVRVGLTSPRGARPRFDLDLGSGDKLEVGFVDTGVPHTVIVLGKGMLDKAQVETLGREIRYHELFTPAGTNVNFVEQTGKRSLRVRTYERGVEGETLACGTGAVASAVITALRGLTRQPVEVTTRGGDVLTIHLDASDPSGGKVFLEGAAHLVYRGELTDETIRGGK